MNYAELLEAYDKLEKKYEEAERQVRELREQLAAEQREHEVTDRISSEEELRANRYATDLVIARSQLDTAMGLLREHQWQWQPYDDHYHRDSGHRCVECGGYRDGSGHEEYCELGNFLNTSTEGKDHA